MGAAIGSFVFIISILGIIISILLVVAVLRIWHWTAVSAKSIQKLEATIKSGKFIDYVRDRWNKNGASIESMKE